jgi:hypothetical protein
LVGISFLTSHKVLPLQAADLFAWEFYRHALRVFEAGRVDIPVIGGMLHLAKNIELNAQIATKNAIQRMKTELLDGKPEAELAQMADHFRNFAPARQ